MRDIKVYVFWKTWVNLIDQEKIREIRVESMKFFKNNLDFYIIINNENDNHDAKTCIHVQNISPM